MSTEHSVHTESYAYTVHHVVVFARF